MTDTINVAGLDVKINALTDGQTTALYRIYEVAQMPGVSGLALVKEMTRAERIILACIVDDEEREAVSEKLELGQSTLTGLMQQIFATMVPPEEPAQPVRRPRGRPRKSA